MIPRMIPHRSFLIFISLLAALLCGEPVQAQPIPFSKEQLFQIGTLAARDGEYEKAIEFFKKVIEIDPRFAPAYNSLGLVQETWESGDPREALRYFKLATDIDPNFVECWDNQGRAYYAHGNFSQAAQAFLKSLSLNPQQPDIDLALGWVYLLGQSRSEEAITYFKHGLQGVDDAMVHYGLGLAYLLEGDKFKVLEEITELRHRQKETEASRLEIMIRQDIKISSKPGTPLVTGKEEEASLFDKELAALGKSKVAGDGSGKGIQVRLKGPLW